MAEQQQDVDALKRRGRRRLVGAVALVLLAVIVLPMVFDAEPRKTTAPVSVSVPGQDDKPFVPKGPKPPAGIAEKASEPPPAPKAEPKAGVEKTSGTALAVAEFIVPVGAFANPDGVVAKLAAAKVPYYTEPAPGNLTRVRAGPFPSREAADKASARVKGLGLQPGPVVNRSG